jgi:hypothetical protein
MKFLSRNEGTFTILCPWCTDETTQNQFRHIDMYVFFWILVDVHRTQLLCYLLLETKIESKTWHL